MPIVEALSLLAHAYVSCLNSTMVLPIKMMQIRAANRCTEDTAWTMGCLDPLWFITWEIFVVFPYSFRGGTMNRILPGPRLDPFADVIRSRMTVYRQIEFLYETFAHFQLNLWFCTFSANPLQLYTPFAPSLKNRERILYSFLSLLCPISFTPKLKNKWLLMEPYHHLCHPRHCPT